MSEQLGTMLVRLRQRKEYSQLRVAEGLCAASGTTTITRHEVSRWERQERIPSAFWLRWLAEVLEVPMVELEVAAAMTRKDARSPARASSAAGVSDNGRTAATPEARTAQKTSSAANRTSAPSNGGDPLSRVRIEFEHQSTSVQLNATYEDPRRAVSAIGVFRAMVGDSEPAREPSPAKAAAAGTNAPEKATRQPRQALPSVRQQSSSSARAVLTVGKSPDVPMGIRYTSGHGISQNGE